MAALWDLQRYVRVLKHSSKDLGVGDKLSNNKVKCTGGISCSCSIQPVKQPWLQHKDRITHPMELLGCKLGQWSY